jgi:hypothetical protein
MGAPLPAGTTPVAGRDWGEFFKSHAREVGYAAAALAVVGVAVWLYVSSEARKQTFAAQALAVTRVLGLQDDSEKVNPNGGAIALGHPVGNSGCRLTVTCIPELERTGERYGLITLCTGGGLAPATIVERMG